MKFVFIWIIINLFPIVSLAQVADVDGDKIRDAVEKALAYKFAPELRFSKRTPDHYIKFISESDQNIREDNYPCSVEYLLQHGLTLQFYYEGGARYFEKKVENINDLATIRYKNNSVTAADALFDECGDNDVTLEFPDHLYGQPNSFPLYFRCNKDVNSNKIIITYLLFSAYDDKHETAGIGNHRGDWEKFSIVLHSLSNGVDTVAEANIDYFVFAQHEGIEFTLKKDADIVRFVNNTHPKLFVAIGSHAIYPEPGALDGYRRGTGDTDDIFFGNGLIVQSWLQGRELINLGEKGKPFDNTRWTLYRGKWGGNDTEIFPFPAFGGSPAGPVCKWLESEPTNLLDWQTWSYHKTIAQIHPNGFAKKWHGIYIDCYEFVSRNYNPNPNYDYNIAVNWRHKCHIDLPQEERIWISPKNLIDYPPNFQEWKVGIYPGNYPGAVTINKKMTLKAIEGTVIIGR